MAAFVASFINLGCKKEIIQFPGDWQLHYFEIAGNSQSITLVTLSIESQEVGYALTGYSGVNTYECTFIDSEGDGVICSGGVRSTKMAGPLDVLECENRYLNFLSDVTSWKVITDEGMEVLEIRARQKDEEDKDQDAVMRFWRLDLAPSLWEVALLGGESTDGGLTVEFKSDGMAALNTGLNKMSLPYTLNNNIHALTFSQEGLATTAAGSEADMAREKSFVSALLGTQGYSILGNTLTFYGKVHGGDCLLRLERKELVN